MLHIIHICHCDIKPANIVWSPTKGKYLLLDFGMTRFIGEQVGFLTETMFLGTYAFALP